MKKFPLLFVASALLLGGCTHVYDYGQGVAGQIRHYSVRICPCLDITVINFTAETILVRADGVTPKTLKPGEEANFSYGGYSSLRKEIAVRVLALQNGSVTGVGDSRVYRIPYHQEQRREVWEVRTRRW